MSPTPWGLWYQTYLGQDFKPGRGTGAAPKPLTGSRPLPTAWGVGIELPIILRLTSSLRCRLGPPARKILRRSKTPLCLLVGGGRAAARAMAAVAPALALPTSLRPRQASPCLLSPGPSVPGRRRTASLRLSLLRPARPLFPISGSFGACTSVLGSRRGPCLVGD